MAALTFFPEAPSVHIALRPYQEEAITCIQDAWKKPDHRALIQLATGMGKTLVWSRAGPPGECAHLDPCAS